MNMQSNATPKQESGAGERIDGLVRVVEDTVASTSIPPEVKHEFVNVDASPLKPNAATDYTATAVIDEVVNVDASPLKPNAAPDHTATAVIDEVINVDASPLKPLKPNVGTDRTAIAVTDEVINVDGSPLKQNVPSDGNATAVINVENVEFNIDHSFDNMLLRHVYAFDGAGNEFVVNPTDKKGFKGSILKTFTGFEKNGYGEIDLIHFQTWYSDLRFASMLTENGKHVNGKAWHFKLLMMFPTASQIHTKANTQNQNNVISFLPKLKKFYQDLFSLTPEAKKTITLAINHDISFVIVGQLCNVDSVLQPWWKTNKQLLKVIAAVTFRPAVVPKVVPRHVNVHVSWLGVKGNLSQPPPPEAHQGWRRQGFGLFMLKCMIKSQFARTTMTKTVDVYLQCCERQTYNCYRKLGFHQVNELDITRGLTDGFEDLPSEMQDQLLRKPSTSRTAGECLFHFYFPDFHKKPYRLLLLRSGCLRYFPEPETNMSNDAITSHNDMRAAEAQLRKNTWCYYPSPKVFGQRYEFDSQTIRGWFKDLPLITDLLPPPYDFTLPSSTIGLKGNIPMITRMKQSIPLTPDRPAGQQWLGNGEIDLMLTTLMWDGRYHDVCTVLSSNDTQIIEIAYTWFLHYTQAYQCYDDAETRKKKDPTIDMEKVRALILQRHKHAVHQLYDKAQYNRNWVINAIIARNPTILSRRLIVIPHNEGDKHWSCIFVFNPFYIDRQNEKDALRTCFFKYCSLRPTGNRDVQSQSVTWFLNLCYSVNHHEKTHSINTGVALKMLFPFGHINFGCMVGTNAFPALKFPSGSDFLPKQFDDFSCGVGVAAATGIVLRDVIHKGLNHFDEVFAVNRMPLADPVGKRKEVYCDMPEVFFTSLATRVEGDYLALIREQWFYMFDNMAVSQHVNEPTLRFGDTHTVLQEYTDAVEKCKGWPASDVSKTKKFLGKKSPRKVDPPKAPKEETATPSSDNKPKRLDLASEHAFIPEPDQSRLPDVATTNYNNDGEDLLVDTDEDEAELSTTVNKAVRVKAVTFLQETDTEFKLDDAGQPNYLNGSVQISRMEDGVLRPISDDHVIRNADDGKLCEIEGVKLYTESVNLASRPMMYKTGKVKRPAKRKREDVEVTAELLLKKIKGRSEKDFKAFQDARVVVPKRAREICCQSRAICDVVPQEFGTDMPPLTELDPTEYQAELTEYIENSFKAWNWHSRREHLTELGRWESRLKNPLVPLSKDTRAKIVLMIKALKKEREYYSKHFEKEFKFSQKTLVRSVKFDESNDRFVAQLGWIDIIPVFATPKKRKGTGDDFDKPDSYTKVEKNETMIVEKDWVREQFGEVMYQQIVNMRQDPVHMWVKAPRDVEMYIGKDKVVSVRYVAETTMNIVDTKALAIAIEEELSAHAKSLQSADSTRVTRRRLKPQLPSADNAKVPFVPKAQLDPPRMQIKVPAKWAGKIKNGRTVKLDEEFVRASFGNVFANQMKKDQKGFVDIPVGDFKPSRLQSHPHLVSGTCPRIRFVQAEGKDLCVTKSLASAFFALGWHDQGVHIDHFGETVLKGFAMKALEQVGEHTKRLFPPWIVITRILPGFNWKTDLWSTDVFVGVLLASDGSCSHAVTIHGGFVFDANENVAMLLCAETLDYCTSTATVKTTFVRFKRGYLYRVYGKKKNRIARMTLKNESAIE